MDKDELKKMNPFSGFEEQRLNKEKRPYRFTLLLITIAFLIVIYYLSPTLL